MKKQTILVAALSTALVIPTMTVSAESIAELKQEKKDIEKKKNNIAQDLEAKKKKLQEGQESIEKSAKEVSKLNTKIETTNTKIATVEQEIEITKEEISKLQLSIEKLQKQIDERAEVLNDRARAMQETGGQVGYIDVILGANSFADFIDRASAVKQIVDADESIINEQKEDKSEVKKQQDEVKEQLEKQENRKYELEGLKSDLNDKKAEKQSMLKQMEKQQAQLNRERKKLEGDFSEAITVSKKVQSKIEEEQRKAIEKARKLAAEKAAKEAEKAAKEAAAEAAKKATKFAVAGSVEVNNKAPKVTAGTWMKPTTGRLTSGYSGRNIGSGHEFHYGIDIANSAGTPIVAAADGVVFKASALSSYGNVVMITHNINGKTFTTVYAHMSGFATSSGKAVKKGQVIGYMGSTGRSTGPHLHFEMHEGSWVNQATGVLNPLQYISM